MYMYQCNWYHRGALLSAGLSQQPFSHSLASQMASAVVPERLPSLPLQWTLALAAH